MHIEDFCEEQARKGDGQFAIAHAIYSLTRETKVLGTKVGDLDEVAGALLTIADALKNLESDNA